MINRVTGLGEFALVGRIFASGSFLKTRKVAQIFALLFFPL
jgi:hypothetical protein